MKLGETDFFIPSVVRIFRMTLEKFIQNKGNEVCKISSLQGAMIQDGLMPFLLRFIWN